MGTPASRGTNRPGPRTRGDASRETPSSLPVGRGCRRVGTRDGVRRRARFSPRSSASLIAYFAAASANGGFCASSEARRMVSGSRSALGTSFHIRPCSNAERASIDLPSMIQRPGLLRSNPTGESLGTAPSRHHAEIDLGLSELCVFTGDYEIAGRRQSRNPLPRKCRGPR